MPLAEPWRFPPLIPHIRKTKKKKVIKLRGVNPLKYLLSSEERTDMTNEHYKYDMGKLEPNKLRLFADVVSDVNLVLGNKYLLLLLLLLLSPFSGLRQMGILVVI